MKQVPKPPNTLVQWIYSPEEWSAFRKSQKNGTGFFPTLSRVLFGWFQRKTPVVRITPEMIAVGSRCRHFNNNRTFIKAIDLCDESGVNVLFITFATGENVRSAEDVMLVPVPKGKLKEAIRLQENLLRAVNV